MHLQKAVAQLLQLNQVLELQRRRHLLCQRHRYVDYACQQFLSTRQPIDEYEIFVTTMRPERAVLWALAGSDK
jgi:hypothetical protein